MSDAGHGADQLGNSHNTDRQADIDLPACKDSRHNRGEHQLNKILPCCRPESLSHMTQLARHTVHAVERVNKEYASTNNHQHKTDTEFDAWKPQHREQDP